MSLAALTRDDVAQHCADLPLPGRGHTRARWDALIAVGRQDLALAKLVEPHHDAVAILDELDGPLVRTGEVWAVWAAEPPFAVVRATETADGWRLSGRKAFCSGAALVTHALVTAACDDGPGLFAIEVDAPGVGEDDAAPAWVGPGMQRARTSTLELDGVAADRVGGPGDYVDRPGFWLGGIGVAACWFGGTLGVADLLERSERLSGHALAHRGAIRAGTQTFELALHAAADRADAGLDTPSARRLALALRAGAAALAEDVASRTGRATGPGPLAFDEEHARRVADLAVFVRQHHAEADLESLGSLP